MELHILQFIRDFKLQTENRTLNGNHIRGSISFVHAEELKIPAEVKNVKLLLVLTIQKPRTQAGSATDHLPEFCLAQNLFEKDQIQNLRHIDAGVQHIHRDGNLRQFLRVRKFVNGTLRITKPIVDHHGIAVHVRIFLIEHFEDFFCVVVALGKNNRFSNFAAVVDFQGVLHHDIQDLPNGVLVEQPAVQSRCINAGRQVAVFILKGVFVGFPFFVRKLIIGDAFLHELYFALHREEVNQKAILDGLRQLITIGGHTVFEVKDLVGVFVDLILGCGGQANQRCIEIMEDVAVFIVDGTVCFIADDHIKVATGEQLALCIVNGINAVHHGLIG